MLMIYFSGTGNSKYIAELFSKNMPCDCHSIEENLDFFDIISQHETIAVCYPIYGSCVPRNMREFVEKHNKVLKHKRLIVFCTQALFSGDGAKQFANLLPNCHVIYAEHFFMPNNICNIKFMPITEFERKLRLKSANKKLKKIIPKIRLHVVRRKGWSKFSRKLGAMQRNHFMPEEDNYRKTFKTDESCNGCGLCTKHCPSDNLEMIGRHVIQKNNCVLCYRCVNLCPTRSARVLLRSKPKKQYKGILKKSG